MKNSFKLIGLGLLLVILATCKKDKVTEEEILTQQEQKIIDKVESFMPEQIGSMFENQFSNLHTLKDYALYLDSIEASIDELKSAIELNFSLNEFEKAMNNALLALEDSEKGSLNDCMGLGYAKGVQIEVGGSGTLAYYVAAGLQAGGGGGIKVIYDFVNLDRQLYYYHLCTGGFTIGAGIGAAFNGCIGFSGVNEVITGIRYNHSNSGLNKFEGAGWSYEYSLGAKAATVLGVQISLGIGTSKSAYADFGSISNPIPCPEDVAKIENGTAEYSFQVQGTLSLGAQAELKAALSIDGVITNSYGVEKTYTNFASNRILAGIRMAKEIMLPEPLDGIAAITNTFDLASAAVAIIYSLRDFSNCPPEIPSIGTIPITNITDNSATTGGFVEDSHGATVTARGVCWSTSDNPTIALTTKTSDGTGTGVFTSNITNLSANTKYYICAYATNSAGTVYGKQESFKTIQSFTTPTVTTTPVSVFTSSSATVSGNVTSDGGSTVTERGVYWGTSINTESTGTKLQIGSGTGAYSTSLPGLTPNTTYYVKAYAKNSQGQAYGDPVNFKTLSLPNYAPSVPSVISPTNGASEVSTSTILNWSCTDPDGDALTFDVYFGTTNNPTTTIATDQSTASLSRTGLTTNTTYYWKVIAKDNKGASTPGPVWSFKTTIGGSAPVANFTADNRTILAGGTVTFADQSTNNPTSWSWNFGDNTSSISRNPSHIYSTAGTYTVTLTASNNFGSDGETKAGYITVNLAGSAPVVNFTVAPSTITAGGTVQFTDQSTNNPTSWSWNFGDGHTSNIQSPTHTYASAGTYTISLTASNSFGTDEETIVGYIVNSAGSAPVANFTVDNRTITAGGSIQFTDQSTNNPTSWSWNFGDNTSSTSRNPSHIYSTAGTYTVTLTASNSFGLDVETKAGYITVSPAESGFNEVYNPATGKAWMDRNLGASQVATSSTDAQSYGDLYQWGRAADGHQIRTSGTTTSLSSSDTPGHGNFILPSASAFLDWRSPQNTDLWQGESGVNNPCPIGYRLPTEAEWNAERLSWGSNNAAGAIASPIKLPMAGIRRGEDGSLLNVGSSGVYWTSTVSSTFSYRLSINSSNAGSTSYLRGYGYSVRCIKE